MHQEIQIARDMYWVGGNDRRLALFENVYPIPKGVSYNAYLVLDQKTILLDTVDKAVAGVFFENLAHLLQGKTLDYVVINHVEPDHCASLQDLILRYPQVKIVTNQKAATMLKQFFTCDLDSHLQLVKEGDTLSTGKHTYSFLLAPMVHWPEVMLTYDTTDKILYSADAFGSFGALRGNIFADCYDFKGEWLPEARRYLTNIVGKYGLQINNTLKKAAALELKLICPLHGPVWRQDLDRLIDKYSKWATYTPEESSVLIAYGSVYGNTENAAEILANELGRLGVKNIAMYDVSATHPSYILAECFRYSHLVFASATYNNGIFDCMHTLLHDLTTHNLQNRKIAIIENGSWAPVSGKQMQELLTPLKGTSLIEPRVTIKSGVKEEQRAQLAALAEAIAQDLGTK